MLTVHCKTTPVENINVNFISPLDDEKGQPIEGKILLKTSFYKIGVGNQKPSLFKHGLLGVYVSENTSVFNYNEMINLQVPKLAGFNDEEIDSELSELHIDFSRTTTIEVNPLVRVPLIFRSHIDIAFFQSKWRPRDLFSEDNMHRDFNFCLITKDEIKQGDSLWDYFEAVKMI